MNWLLLDRDDTILDDPGYLKDPERLKFLPGAVEGLKRFAEAGWPLVLVTNQSGIGRGYFGVEELQRVHERMEEMLAQDKVGFAAIYFCPHAPDDGCDCRKPSPKLAHQAARELNLKAEHCVVVGDKDSDLQLGRQFEAKYVAQIVAKRAASSLADGHFESVDRLADFLLEVPS